MECPFCQSLIVDDSLFCDQCGKELLLCPLCHKPGKGKACIFDGSKLVPATSLKSDIENGEKTSEKREVAHETSCNEEPEIQLTNARLGLFLKIKSGQVIGRTNALFADKLGSLKQISGSHARIDFDGSDWLVTDLDSTNGTKVSENNTHWDKLPLIKPDTPTVLKHKGFLLIANIEFSVEMKNRETTNKTQRL